MRILILILSLSASLNCCHDLNLNTLIRLSEDGEEPTFTSKHMNIVFTLLLPHLSRWKSLSILTDCWAPMYTALTAINPVITHIGAPLLESLSLMRCNDLISFSPIFQPQKLKEPEFLTRGGQNSECPIPSLKYLSLRGVHVNWDSLGDILSTSETGLTCLVLGAHSDEVRPSRNQLFKILSSSIGLRNLVLSASGPSLSASASGPSTSSAVQNDRASLPHLRNLTIGYRTAMEGIVALNLINAPCTKKLVLEDATYVGDLNDINAAPLLSYFGTGQFVGTHQNSLLVPFPLLERLILTRVKTSSQIFTEFFRSPLSSNLLHLELKGMSMEAIHALLPDENCYTNLNSGCPLACPKLRSLCISQVEQLDVEFIIGNFDRQTMDGACPLEKVDIYVNAATAANCVLQVPPTSLVTIFYDYELAMQEEGDSSYDEYYASFEEIPVA
jgi:hypothetical protein